MDLKKLTAWLEEELQWSGLGVELSDSIAQKGFVGNSTWVAIGWDAEESFLGKAQIDRKEFDALEHFGDLADLIGRLREDPSRLKTPILHVA